MSNATTETGRDVLYYGLPEGIDVVSWCPTPDGSGQPTQVHMRIGEASGPVITIRFKSASGLDGLIAALRDHRRDVWGE